jgi:hypothetical protein
MNETVWTTEFFKEKVVLQPCERPENEPRGYKLDFGNEEISVVPEKVRGVFSRKWKFVGIEFSCSKVKIQLKLAIIVSHTWYFVNGSEPYQ